MPELHKDKILQVGTTGIVLWQDYLRVDHILLGWRLYDGHWEFPGGRVDPGETCIEAVTREVLEETNLATAVTAFAGYHEHTERNTGVLQNWLNMIYECRISESIGLLNNNEPDKFVQWKWFPMNDMPLNEMWDVARHVFHTYTMYYGRHNSR